MYKRETLEKKICTLKASIYTLTVQLKQLKNFTPAAQQTIWRKNKAILNAELRQYEAKFKQYYGNQLSTNL